MPDLVLTPITYFELFGTAATAADLIDLVRAPAWKLVASRCIGIAAISWQHGIEDTEHQLKLFEEFGYALIYGPAIASILQRESHRRIYTRESLLAVLRIAVVHHAEPGSRVSDIQFADIFHKALLMANELINNEINPISLTKSGQDFLATELRSNLAQQQNVHDLIARTAAMFEWNDTSRGRAHGGALALRDDFKRFTGLAPEEYAAATYLALSRSATMRTWNQAEIAGPAFDPNQWLAHVKDPAPTIWFERHAESMDRTQKAWAAESSFSFAGAGPLWKTPLIRDAEGLLFAPSPFFITNMLGDGTYFELFDGYRERNSTFSTLYGHFFQDYIEDRFRGGYDNRDDAKVWADVPYVGGQSSDVIVNEAKHVIFIEVVAKRMQLVGSVLKLDAFTIATDLRRGVTDKLRQLRDNIEAFRAGTLLPEIPRVEGQRLYPVLVAPREWPRIYVLLHLLNMPQYANAFADCEPLELLDVGEVEDLEGRLRVGMRFAELLDRKNRSTKFNRALSLHNYLTAVEPGTWPIPESPTRKRGSECALALIEIAKKWEA